MKKNIKKKNKNKHKRSQHALIANTDCLTTLLDTISNEKSDIQVMILGLQTFYLLAMNPKHRNQLNSITKLIVYLNQNIKHKLSFYFFIFAFVFI